jgi:hypothetical protein
MHAVMHTTVVYHGTFHIIVSQSTYLVVQLHHLCIVMSFYALCPINSYCQLSVEYRVFLAFCIAVVPVVSGCP